MICLSKNLPQQKIKRIFAEKHVNVKAESIDVLIYLVTEVVLLGKLGGNEVYLREFLIIPNSSTING
jgi:hypothetical protein